LLEAGRPADAAAAFRDDLRYVRETGWSLSGLERALRADGKVQDAADAQRRFKAAWKYADVAVGQLPTPNSQLPSRANRTTR
jgi:hypothetical protein